MRSLLFLLLFYDSFWDRHGVVGECAVVARSFTELLSNLFYNQGDDYPYWLEADFEYIGDAYDLIYKDGDYMYYDTYFGAGKFAGEEALWIKGNPYWAMNYIGRVTGENFSGDFLKDALLRVPQDKPFRGPETYTDGDYSYHCEIEGDFNWFQGKEIITYKDSEIYECVFHGGLVE